MRALYKRFTLLLDEGMNKEVFDNLRNFLTCALLFAAGSNSLREGSQLIWGLFISHLAGWGLTLLAATLMAMNIADGVRKLSKLRYPILLQTALCVLYVVLVVRVVEIVWHFRAP